MTIKAGEGALDSLKRDGFDISRIGTIAGASGGAKWLSLSQLDRAILATVVPRLKGPVHLIGTSIGAWRSSCYAQNDPLAAIERFEEAYVEQSYSEKPGINEITAKSREIMGIVLGDTGVDEILSNPVFELARMWRLRTAMTCIRNTGLLRISSTPVSPSTIP
ncbi:MAG: patatin-like phospholipase family protein, partial [Pseudomonadota bacterium]